MPTSAAALRSRFVEDGATGAPPQVLLIALYDRLLIDLRHGAAALREGDRIVSHNKLIHAQAIVSALQVALDGSDWGATSRLQALYSYLLTELAQANVKQEPERVDACLSLVEPLREAWFQASIDLASASASASASSTPAPSTAFGSLA